MFTTDRQTLADLHIFGRQGADSIYSIYNHCATKGGAALLEEFFRHPMSDAAAINTRAGIFRYFMDAGLSFPFDSGIFDALEPYLANTDQRTKLDPRQDSLAQHLGRALAPDTQTAMIYGGVNSLLALLKTIPSFLSRLPADDAQAYGAERRAITEIVFQPALAPLLGAEPTHARLPGSRLSHAMIAEFDVLLRFRHRDSILKLLRHVYFLDVCMAVGRVAAGRGFVFPVAQGGTEARLSLTGFYHPQLANPVRNTIFLDRDANLLFLTGANMAGKSTLMKSLALALFLAHMGFPMAAERMEFTVLDGLYTTINLPDDLGMGASHFYAEVLRVKKMATELRQGRRLFILFDELFRGTNVKDAYAATVAVATRFARKTSSLFVLSTHIIEAGELLKQNCPTIRFGYLPTTMNGTHPVYTYRLENGITDDRHGMLIIGNEGILDTLAARSGAETVPGAPREAAQSGAAAGDQPFIADRQTMEDLNLLGKFKRGSVYSLFDHVKTNGGRRLLDDMFRHPLTEPAAINQRARIFRCFADLRLTLPVEMEACIAAESYLGGVGSGSFLGTAGQLLLKRIKAVLLRDEQYAQLCAGLAAAIDLLCRLKALVAAVDPVLSDVDIPLVRRAREIFADGRLSWLNGAQELSFAKIARYDALLRGELHNEMETLLSCLYNLDVYITVSNVARKRGLSYAEALPAERNLFEASALWHPALENPVANPLAGSSDANVLFLTGANMAGKSTFMKSVGIAVYLAHMGFPVAARDLQFSVRDGLYTSINVADDLAQGYSHFYAEVQRVKTVADAVDSGRNLLVIFDELFKGTNVKDAYDATLQVTAAFSNYRNCLFIISTHIIEVGEALRVGHPNVRFAYLPTVMEGLVPRYTYRLTEGITDDRHGMVILENEGVFEILER